jgi:hypothetical protein
MRASWVLVYLVAVAAQAGDYYLTVADKPSCAKPSIGQSYTSRQVVADLDRYFGGVEPQIDVFETAVRNGSMGFCSTSERQAIEDALIKWAVRAPAEHELQLYDAFLTLGSQRVADELAARLATATDPGVKSRLTRAREATLRGVRTRKR